MQSPEKSSHGFSALAARLREALKAPLPGYEAQKRLAPRPRAGLPEPREGRGRPAAGLVLLYPIHDTPVLLLTVRSDALPKHAGQVSFPGGLQERDETLEQTALREAAEEVGTDPSAIELLGALSPLFIPPTGFRLHPFVGITRRQPRLRVNSREVARVIEVPLERLRDPEIVRTEDRLLRGTAFVVPYFFIQEEKVWGATAMVLAEFIGLLEAF